MHENHRNLESVHTAWPDVLASVREQSRATHALLMGATLISVRDDVLVIAAPGAPRARQLATERNSGIVRQSLRRILGSTWRVRFADRDQVIPRV